MNRSSSTLLALLLSLPPGAAAAITPITPDAGARTGRIIGAAAGCGLAQADLDRASRKAAAALRAATRDPAELKRLQARHKAAFEAEAERTKSLDEAACTPLAEAFLAYLKEKS